MKHTTRKLLSLLLALAVMCSMVPAAMAADWWGSNYPYYSDVTLAPGQSTTLSADFSTNASGGSFPLPLYAVDWQSSDPSVVSVTPMYSYQGHTSTSASVRANYAGTATITATAYYGYSSDYIFSSYDQSWVVTVTGSGIGQGTATGSYTSISQGSAALSVGGSGSLSVYSLYPQYYTISSVTWSSGNSGVVSVSPTDYYGTTASIYGQTSGTAVVYAYVTGYYNNYQQFSDTLSCVVTVGSGSGTGTGVGNGAQITPATTALNVGGSGSLSVSPLSSQYTISSVSWASSDSRIASVSPYTNGSATAVVTGLAAGTATIYAYVTGYYSNYQQFSDTLSCVVTVGGAGSGVLYLSESALAMSPNSYGTLTAYSAQGYPTDPNTSVIWKTSAPSIVNFGSATVDTTSGSSVNLYSGSATGQATVTATATIGGKSYTASCIVTVGSSVSVKATVFTGETGFTLGSTNSKTSVSVVDQIVNSLYYYTGVTTNRTLSHVVFNNVTSNYGSLNAIAGQQYSYSYYGSSYYSTLSSVTFTPSQTSTGVATFSFTAYDVSGSTYPGTLTITVEKGSSNIDILYSLTAGQSKALDVTDFTDFWSTVTSGRGTLEYVTFGAASGSVGRLAYTRTGSTQSQSQVTSGTRFYTNPSYNQYGISAVTFIPNGSASRYSTGTLVVPFTAYGTGGSYTSATTSQSGSLYIVVTNGQVQSINYQPSASGVTLKGDDFASVYKQAVSNATANPTVYIQFLDVPTFGELYYNYSSNSYYPSRGTKLTASNIGTMRFSSRSTTTYSINALTYIPGSGRTGDTIRYAAFSSANGGTLLYVGEISFGTASSASAIKYYGAPGKAVSFRGSDFNSDSALTYTSYITFGTPSSGTLYKNYTAGTRVTSTDTFSIGSGSTNSVNSVTFVPSSNYTGVVEIPFTSFGLTGGQVRGTVKVYVAPTFSDVAATNWAYEYVTQLVAEKVVSGTTPTTFSPNANVKYGEALKMILIAAGYPAQTELSGSNWASNYLTLAYNYGIVSSKNVNLNAAVDRNTIASIAAKALKISQASSINRGIVGPTDSRDGYVYALYNAGILNGTTTNGVNRYNGTSALTRAELAAIVCRVSDYHSANK